MLPRRTLALLLGIFAGSATMAFAQTWPAKPVRVVVNNIAGSLSDNMARLVFSRVNERLDGVFVIDNRPGAGGTVGTEYVAKSSPDGYTLLIATNSMMAAYPYLYSKPTFDPLRDFAPVSMMVKISEILVVNGSLGVKSMDDFLRLARAQPGKINYASGGNGHPTHLMMELFLSKAKLDLVHVPYKTTPAAIQALISGEVGAFAIGVGLALPHIRSGKFVALATIGPRAENTLAEVRPLSSYFPDSELVNWLALLAPAGTPRQIVDRLSATIVAVLALPEIRSRLSAIGLVASAGSPSELEQSIRADQALNRELVKKIGLKLD